MCTYTRVYNVYLARPIGAAYCSTVESDSQDVDHKKPKYVFKKNTEHARQRKGVWSRVP